MLQLLIGMELVKCIFWVQCYPLGKFGFETVILVDIILLMQITWSWDKLLLHF